MGEWRYSSKILDLGTKWRLVVSLKLRPHYSQRKKPRYLLDRRLVGPESRSERYRIEKNLIPLPGIEPRSFSQKPVAEHTHLSRLF
jgi:hypothetical protein